MATRPRTPPEGERGVPLPDPADVRDPSEEAEAVFAAKARAILDPPTLAASLDEVRRRLRDIFARPHRPLSEYSTKLTGDFRHVQTALRKQALDDGTAAALLRLGYFAGFDDGFGYAQSVPDDHYPEARRRTQREFAAERGAKGGGSARKRAKRQEEWNRWIDEAKAIRRIHPKWSPTRIYNEVAKKFGRKPSGIRSRFRLMGFRV